MADDDVLVPNPDGCQAFEPNPFKKEYCKNCRKRWEEHKGVIEPKFVQEFLEARRKAAEEKEKAMQAQREKERAKAAAKKKATQAADDEWYFEGKEKEEGGDDSDEDVGFKMLSPGDMKSKAQSQAKPQQLVVKNLIDFDECDAADPEPPQKLGAGGGSGDFDMLPGGGGGGLLTASATAPMPAFSPMVSGDEVQPLAAPSFPEAHLRAELEHLEMRLAQANEEKKLELEIVHDELTAKEKMVAELKQERDLANEKLKELSGGAPTAPGAEGEGAAVPPPVSTAAAELVSDLQALCASTPALSGSCPGAEEADAGRTGCRVRNMGELENELKKVRQFITTAVEAAREAQEARTALPRPAGAEDAADHPTNGLSAALGATAGRAVANASEAQLTAQAIGEVSATAFREIRTSADTQITWIKQRLSQKTRGLLRCAA